MSPDRIANHLVRTLTLTDGLNEFFESAVPLLAESFGAQRAIFIDYRETTGRFDMLHFAGYPTHGRFELQRRTMEMDLQKALVEKEPYFCGANRLRLYLPLYFMTTLESLIVLEADEPIELTPVRREIAKIASTFIGLLMSSNRLSINQNGIVDFNDLQRARQIQLTYLPAENLETDRYEVYGYNNRRPSLAATISITSGCGRIRFNVFLPTRAVTAFRRR